MTDNGPPLIVLDLIHGKNTAHLKYLAERRRLLDIYSDGDISEKLANWLMNATNNELKTGPPWWRHSLVTGIGECDND